MKYILATILAAGVVTFANGNDKDILLKTEREYVAELLALGKPQLAQQHLDIIRREFPKEIETIHFYQGQISFTREDYETAVKSFAIVLKKKPTRIRKQLVTRRLIEGYTRLGMTDEAHALLQELPTKSGTGAWYPVALQNWAEAVHQKLAPQSARKRVPGKKDCVKLLQTFAEKHPQDARIPWVKYYLAEHQYDRLIELLLEKGKISREDAPVVVKKEDDVIIVQLHQTRRHFADIKKAYPRHAVIKRVDPRLKYLNVIIERVD